MSVILDAVRTKCRTPVALTLLGVAVVAFVALTFLRRERVPDDRDPEERLFVQVKRAVSGQKIKLDNDQDEYLMLAGIRAPVGGEPFYDEATKRSDELVSEKKVRLRFDPEHRDSEGRLLAYVFVDDTFMNELLVKEGLAYARQTTASNRFAERLLAAQTAAQKAHRGIWGKRSPGNERSYAGDPKYGNFHRKTCEETAKIPSDRLVQFPTDRAALEKGFAPCAKCKP